jgi:hypothetical protein
MRIYEKAEALRPELLSEIYETPVKMGWIDGRPVIVPEEVDGDGRR